MYNFFSYFMVGYLFPFFLSFFLSLNLFPSPAQSLSFSQLLFFQTVSSFRSFKRSLYFLFFLSPFFLMTSLKHSNFFLLKLINFNTFLQIPTISPLLEIPSPTSHHRPHRLHYIIFLFTLSFHRGIFIILKRIIGFSINQQNLILHKSGRKKSRKPKKKKKKKKKRKNYKKKKKKKKKKHVKNRYIKSHVRHGSHRRCMNIRGISMNINGISINISGICINTSYISRFIQFNIDLFNTGPLP